MGYYVLTVRNSRYLELLTDSMSQVVPEVTLLQSFSRALSFSLSFFVLPPHFGSFVSFVKGELNTGREIVDWDLHVNLEGSTFYNNEKIR